MENTGDDVEDQGDGLWPDATWLDERGWPVVEDLNADNKRRRRHELFTHLRSDLSYSARVLCRVILGRLGPHGYTPDPDSWCTAGIPRLARDVGVGPDRIYELLAEAEEAGVLLRRTNEDGYLRTSVFVSPTDQMKEWVTTLWYRTRPSAPLREWKDEVAGSRMEGEKGPPGLVDRMYWCRHVRDHPTLDTTTKAVAFGVDILLRRNTGLAARRTTVDELSDLAGCWERVVRRELRNLEDQQLLEVRRKRGRGGGLYLRATLPGAEVEEMYRSYAHL